MCLSKDTRKCTVLAQAHWELNCAHFMYRKHRRSCTVREEAHSELYVLAQAYKLSLA